MGDPRGYYFDLPTSMAKPASTGWFLMKTSPSTDTSSGPPATRAAAYHVRKSVSHPKIYHGQKDINRISLGIEIVNAQFSSDTFSEWQVEATAEIVRYAWAKIQPRKCRQSCDA